MIALRQLMRIEVAQVKAVAPGDRGIAVDLGVIEQPEAGREHQHIDIALGTAAGADARPGDRLDRIGDQVDIVPVEGLQVRTGDRGPLATEVVVRGEFGAKLLIRYRHPVGHVAQEAGYRLRDDLDVRVIHDAVHQHPRIDEFQSLLQQPLRQRDPAKEGLDGARCGGVELGEDPDRRALVDVEVTDFAGDIGNDLYGAGPGADDGDPLARQVDALIPGCRFQDGAREVVEPR
ncbi:Uncharacterised protein [Mycobacteroides abscessus subsp. abscessus]|nr:Uncharacterised protein [Mycobacteroides abscessus subsp. abscessus]